MNTHCSDTGRRSVRGWWLALAALLALFAGLAAVPSPAAAGVFVSVNFAPPPLPIYVQPMIPGPGYIWSPGYWAYDPIDGYYWVPGTWVLPPYAGALWTPGWWGWYGGGYRWHTGYWGLHVGFYGGINYGFGYIGTGYVGGYWRGGQFFYNRAVNNINVTNIRNVYVNKTVINNYNNSNITRVSYNGGPNGVAARPTPQEALAEHESHVGPVAAQQRQMQMASRNQALRASMNHGTPPIAATRRPGAFAGNAVVAARGADPQMVARAREQARMQRPTIRADRQALPSAGYAPHARNGIARGGYARGPDRSMQNERMNAEPRDVREQGAPMQPQPDRAMMERPQGNGPQAYHPRYGRGYAAPPQHAPRERTAPRKDAGDPNRH